MPVTLIDPPKWAGRTDPEDGDGARRFYHLMGDNAPRAVLGFACEAGVARNKGRIGAAQGPDAIRKGLMSLAVPTDAGKIKDLGDIQVTGDDLEAGHTHLSIELDKALRHHNRIVVLGGGHETAFGSYSGLRLHYPDTKIGIINLDAHLDLRALGEAGPSSGTPFTQIRNLDPGGFDYLCIGAARESNTEALFQRAKDWGVNVIYDDAISADPKIADKVINAMADRNDILYLTIDLDVLPHYQMPGVSAPAARGVSLEIIERIIDRILGLAEIGKITLPLADIVELSPPHDRDGMSAKTAAFIARRLLLG